MRILTPREAAAVLRISVASLRRLPIPHSLLPSGRGTRRRMRRYVLGELHAWLALHRELSVWEQLRSQQDAAPGSLCRPLATFNPPPSWSTVRLGHPWASPDGRGCYRPRRHLWDPITLDVAAYEAACRSLDERVRGQPAGAAADCLLLTKREAAVVLSVSAERLLRLGISTTLLPSARGVERPIRRYAVSDVRAWLETHRSQSAREEDPTQQAPHLRPPAGSPVALHVSPAGPLVTAGHPWAPADGKNHRRGRARFMGRVWTRPLNE
jgi:hypothetical protein